MRDKEQREKSDLLKSDPREWVESPSGRSCGFHWDGEGGRRSAE